MEQIKIDNFIKENSEINFPIFMTLTKEDCDKISFTLSKKLKIDYPYDCLVLVREVDKHSDILEGKKCIAENFNLNNLLLSLRIKVSEYVYINWYRYDKIDEIKFDDLVTYFDDIWYQNVDDIDIFDRTLTWIISISHYGQIKILRL